ncbi:MAG: 23S rRNA (uracil(1939)-C(5))-methyltransferase RlmD [Bacilli bacterium]
MKNNIECQYRFSCGGCDLLEADYCKQLEYKNQTTEKALAKANIQYERLNSIVPSENITNYRNKIQYNYDITRQGEILCGNYALGSHHLVSIDHCLLENELSYKIKMYFLLLMKDFIILPHCNSQPNGSVKNLVIRTNFNLSEAMVIIVTNSSFFPKSKMIVNNLVKKFSQIKSVVQIINNRHSGYILNGESKLLYGNNYIKDVLCGLTYHISPTSFFQVNHGQTERLYEAALSLSKLTKDDLLLDAYCGIGTIGLTSASKVKEVLGIEIVSAAIEDARNNAERNKIKNVRYKVGDVSKVVERIKDFHPTCVIVDPPRGGLSQKFIGYINYAKPSRLTYISCNQKTLMRDLKQLSKNYEIKLIQPFDMFPLTRKIETLVTLCLK